MSEFYCQRKYGYLTLSKIWLGMFCLYCFSAKSQNGGYCFEHYNQSSGLSQGTGYAIAQYDDYMWFGTLDGLNRFDGYSFRVFRNEDNLGLNNSFVQALLADSKGRLWVGTGSGINIYDKENQRFKSFNEVFGGNYPIDRKLSIKKFMEDKGGNIWIMTEGAGVFRFNPATAELKSFLPTASHLTDFTEDSMGNVWLSSTTGLYKVKNQACEEVYVKTIKRGTPIYALATDSKGQLWVGSYGAGLYILETNSMKVLRHFSAKDELQSNDITCIKQDKSGKMWVGTRTGGVAIYAPDTGFFTSYSHLNIEPTSINDNHIWSLFEDQQNIMWLGLSSKGIDKYDPLKFRFNVLRKNLLYPNSSLPDNMVYKLMGKGSSLYIGTSLAISEYNLKTGIVSPMFSENPVLDLNYFNEVRTISEDQEGNLWMMNWRGMCRYSPLNHQIITFPLPQKSAVYLYSTLALRNRDEIWVGGQNGLSIFSKSRRQWVHKPIERNFEKYIIRHLYQDKEGKVWIGTLGEGLLMFDPISEKLTRFSPKVLCHNIRSLLEDGNTLWVGGDCGLFKLNLSTLKIEGSFAKEAGLPNNVVYGVLKDETGILWISTNQGLARFSPKEGKVTKTYDINDGLQDNEFNTGSAYRHTDGTMYFGGVNGITFFKPQAIKDNTFLPPVKITAIKVLDSLYNPETKEITLTHEQNFIDFEFVAFNFSNTEKNTYRYLLEGINADWIVSGNINKASYTNLPPGKYVFKVKGINNDGIESPQVASVTIIINPAYYQTWWFKFLVCLLAGSLALWVAKNIIANRNLKLTLAKEEAIRLKKESEMKEMEALLNQKIAQMEISALRSQMNPHFIFNCLNSIKLYSIENDSHAASEYLTKFSRLIRLVLENSRTEKIILEKELEMLRLYTDMEVMRFKGKIKFIVNISEDVETHFIEIPPMLIQPFIENAIWHGLMHKEEGGAVTLNVTIEQDSNLFIEVIDNGIGRAKSGEYGSKSAVKNKSFGTNLTQERIKLINHIYRSNIHFEIIDLTDTSGNSLGTKVIIQLPI